MSKRKGDCLEERESKKPRLESQDQEDDILEHATCHFATMPPEMLSCHILRFFDFETWLDSLTLVNKQWYLAAQQSNVWKQMLLDETDVQIDYNKARAVIAKYRDSVDFPCPKLNFLELSTPLRSSQP